MNIVLAGFMGTGKTTAGRLLAQRLSWEFLDTDEMIAAREKMAITRIFQVHGETYFRDCETRAVAEAAGANRTVISLGGGALERPENTGVLKKNGVIVCLDAEPAIIVLRTMKTRDRPLLLKSTDALGVIRELMRKREPSYRQADLFIDTSSLSPEETADAILENLRHAHIDPLDS